MKIDIHERVLHFRRPAATSRGVYTERRIWLVTATDGHLTGVGECAPLPDLSCDACTDYASVLRSFCRHTEQTGAIDHEAMRDHPSMLFGLETAMRSLEMRRQGAEPTISPTNTGSHLSPPISHLVFDTPFSRGRQGIPINGLVWMGTYDEMLGRVEEKLRQGFGCIKLKVGAIDFDREMELVKSVRRRFSHRYVELRLDANGGFAFDEALYRLELLSQYAVHSIEQPIRQGQWANMAELCRNSPLPIALDEELIGVNDPGQKRQLLRIVKPAYIVLKPSLHGGMLGCREWIDAARDEGIGSWMTSALESNVGLNAIAQLCSHLYGPDIDMAQGLGTGQLFTDNTPMPLCIKGDRLWTSASS